MLQVRLLTKDPRCKSMYPLKFIVHNFHVQFNHFFIYIFFSNRVFSFTSFTFNSIAPVAVFNSIKIHLFFPLISQLYLISKYKVVQI